jgi:hypothetical protein
MYKKHGRDKDANLEVKVVAIVMKVLLEQGLSMEPRTLMGPPGELTVVVALQMFPAAKVPLQTRPPLI